MAFRDIIEHLLAQAQPPQVLELRATGHNDAADVLETYAALVAASGIWYRMATGVSLKPQAPLPPEIRDARDAYLAAEKQFRAVVDRIASRVQR